MLRRKLLKLALMLAGAGVLPVSLVQRMAPERRVKMLIVTTFPRTMSRELWAQMESQFIHDGFFNLVTEMCKSREILNQEDTFHGNHVRWNVNFKDYAAYKKWNREVKARGLVNDESYKDMGFRIETHVS